MNALCCGQYPIICLYRLISFSPFTQIDPLVFEIIPLIIDIVVVLPAPFRFLGMVIFVEAEIQTKKYFKNQTIMSQQNGNLILWYVHR